jgi:putative transcriptional regulator
MTKANKRKPLFHRLKSALDEGVQFARGSLNLRVTVMPSPPPPFAAAEVIKLRSRCNLSQRVFARTLNVSTKTVQAWEQGNRRPSQAALRLLQLLDERPEVVREVVGIVADGRQKMGK